MRSRALFYTLERSNCVSRQDDEQRLEIDFTNGGSASSGHVIDLVYNNEEFSHLLEA